MKPICNAIQISSILHMLKTIRQIALKGHNPCSKWLNLICIIYHYCETLLSEGHTQNYNTTRSYNYCAIKVIISSELQSITVLGNLLHVGIAFGMKEYLKGLFLQDSCIRYLVVKRIKGLTKLKVQTKTAQAHSFIFSAVVIVSTVANNYVLCRSI